MEKIEIQLFNSPLEAALRALVVLDTVYPLKYDLTHLTWFDHLVVHTGDINGPSSLHPDLPQRNAELIVRRTIVDSGLQLLKQMNLVDYAATDDGIVFEATDDGHKVCSLLSSEYSMELKEKAQWLKNNVCTLSADELANLIDSKLGRWNLEFEVNNE